MEGLGVGGNFARIPWVRGQFISKLSIDPYPGTLNLEIADAEELQKFEWLKGTPGIEIKPEDPAFCPGRCYRVLIGGKVKGAIVLPMVEDYPQNKMELIASQNLKEALAVRVGDIIEVEPF